MQPDDTRGSRMPETLTINRGDLRAALVAWLQVRVNSHAHVDELTSDEAIGRLWAELKRQPVQV
jgi:hypothetical protein